MITFLLQGAALGLPASAQPGPFQAYLLSQTMKNGWQRTLPAALAPLLSDGPIIVLVVLILTQLPGWFLRGVQIVGGLFLLYLARGAYAMFRSGPVQDVAVAGAVSRQSLLEAAVMNALNPNPYLFWGLAAGPILLQGWRQSALLGVSFLVGFYGTLIGGSALVIILFGTAGRLGSRLNRILMGISAAALFFFGLYQLWQGISGAV